MGPNPALPPSQQPQNIPRVLGQERNQASSWAEAASTAPRVSPEVSAPAAVPGIGQDTASFLGQLLLGELLKRMQKEVTPSPVSSVQSKPTISLETLLRALTQQQLN